MATTLVIGGTGKTGRRIVQRLQAAGRPARIGTPSAAPPFDWTDPPPGRPPLRASARCVGYPDLAVPAPRRWRPSPPWPWSVGSGARCCWSAAASALRGEQALQQSGSGLDGRAVGAMAQNFSEGFFLEPLRAGEVAFPAGEDLAEAVDRRRGHRRRRGRGADRRRARGPAV